MQAILNTLIGMELSETEARTTIAMLDFILTSSAKNGIEGSQLMKELIDLGIPKENCASLAKVHDKNIQKLRANFADNFLRVNKFDEVRVAQKTIYASNSGKNGLSYVDVSVKLAEDKLGQGETVSFCMGTGQLKSFLAGE